MSELSVKKVKKLRKKLKEFIGEVKATPETFYDMASYSGCVFAKTRGRCSTALVGSFFNIPARDLDSTSYQKGLTPLQAKVIRLFTASVGRRISQEDWLKEAKKVSKTLKKYIKENTPVVAEVV